jgi:hypothetical protein
VPFAKCLSVGDDGVIPALNMDGADLIDLLHLNGSPVIDTRRKYLKVLKLRLDFPADADVHELFLDAFGYPDDLPDLKSLRPPGGNRRNPGPVLSHYQLRELNQPGEVY